MQSSTRSDHQVFGFRCPHLEHLPRLTTPPWLTKPIRSPSSTIPYSLAPWLEPLTPFFWGPLTLIASHLPATSASNPRKHAPPSTPSGAPPQGAPLLPIKKFHSLPNRDPPRGTPLLPVGLSLPFREGASLGECHFSPPGCPSHSAKKPPLRNVASPHQGVPSTSQRSLSRITSLLPAEMSF